MPGRTDDGILKGTPRPDEDPTIDIPKNGHIGDIANSYVRSIPFSTETTDTIPLIITLTP